MGRISHRRRPSRTLRCSHRLLHRIAITSTALQIRNNFQPSRFKIRSPATNTRRPARPSLSLHQPQAKKKTNNTLRRSCPPASTTSPAYNAANTTIPPATAKSKKAPSYPWKRARMALVDSLRSQRNFSIRGRAHRNNMTCPPAPPTICTATKPS